MKSLGLVGGFCPNFRAVIKCCTSTKYLNPYLIRNDFYNKYAALKTWLMKYLRLNGSHLNQLRIITYLISPYLPGPFFKPQICVAGLKDIPSHCVTLIIGGQIDFENLALRAGQKRPSKMRPGKIKAGHFV